MLQFDGSDHDWFEARSARCCLFVANRTWAYIAASENAENALRAFKSSCERYGIQASIYLDRHIVYKAEKEGVHTDFSSALSQLGVKIIYAKSPVVWNVKIADSKIA